MGGTVTNPRRVYEQLWRKTGRLLKFSRIQIDSRLQNPAGDPRRGVTLVARPGRNVRKKVEEFLRKTAAICPGQHFYQPAELHVTVLAIISGSEFWRDEIRRLPTCRQVLAEVLRNARPFRVHFRGVTVSPDAVMIQGFPMDDALLQLRDEVRDAFRKAGLGGNLDRRYKTVTAHLTVMRFSEPEADGKRLFEFLQENRETEFGETYFKTVQLIWSNWYASSGVVRVLQKYSLKH